MTEPFRAELRRQPGRVTIDLAGDIDLLADEPLNAAFTEAEHEAPEMIALNFEDVSYINSTGIALIVGLLAQARKNRRNLVVFGLSPHYQKLFAVTRLSDFMQVYPDEASLEISQGKTAQV